MDGLQTRNSRGRGGLVAHAIIAAARMNSIPWIGACAAVFTSLSYIPQLRKAWPRRSTSDLSLKMLVILTAGLTLWVEYGLLIGAGVIVATNSGGAALSASVRV
jgi:MtN3 and saliva related transmembrane protein